MKKIFAIVIISFWVFSAGLVFAIEPGNTPGGSNTPGGGNTPALPTVINNNKYLSEGVKSQYKNADFNPLPGITSLPQYASTLINSLLGVIGSIALIMFTYSGFRWMTAAGDSKAIETSQSAMLWAALGLVMIFSSYALVKFVIGAAGG